jgi:hypothetical protein
MDKLKLIPLVYFSPDGTRLYAFADGKLYFRNYPNGTVWNDITPTTNSTAWSDLQFVPGSSTDFYASVVGSGSGATQIWHFNYANGTHTSSQVNIPFVNFLSGTSNDFKSIKLSLPTSSMLYTILQKTGSTDVALMSYNMVTQTWTAVNNAIPVHQDQCSSCFNLIASPNNRIL